MARREGAGIRTLSTGSGDAGHGPVRSCVGCRARTSASELLRVVAEGGSAHSVAVPDPRRRRPGRGAWLHPDPTCLRMAERRRAFPRALRTAASLDLSAVYDHIAAIAQGEQFTNGPTREAPAPGTVRKQVDPS